jgi:predicted metalloprotease with PDZ domain
MSTVIPSVDHRSPAQRAGIRPGEKLLTINGDADQYDALMERKAEEETERLEEETFPPEVEEETEVTEDAEA